MQLLGFLKNKNTKTSGQGNVVVLTVELVKDNQTFEALSYLEQAQGHAIIMNLEIAECHDDEFHETPQQRKAREKELKDFNDFQRAGGRTLPLDGEAPPAKSADVTETTLPAVEFLTIGDYLNDVGDRFTIGANEGKWVIDTIAAEENSKLAELDVDSGEYDGPEQAREALKHWCFVERGYQPVAPVGYGAVYGQPGQFIYRVAETTDTELPIEFGGYLCREDGTEARRLMEWGAAEPHDAQLLLDDWAKSQDVPLYGYVLLESVQVSGLQTADEPVDKQTIPAICYQNAQEPPHRFSVDVSPDGRWAIKRERDGEETGWNVLSEEDGKTFDSAQAHLNKQAAENNWQPIVADEPEPGVNDLPQYLDTAGATYHVMENPNPDCDANDAYVIAKNGEPLLHVDDPGCGYATITLAQAALDAGSENLELVRTVEEVFSDGPVAEVPTDSPEADAAAGDCGEAPVEEPAAEEAQEAAEQAPEPEAEQVAKQTDVFEDGTSITCLYDLLAAECAKGNKPQIVRKAEFVDPGMKTGPVPVMEVMPDRGGVRTLTGMTTADCVDEQYEIYVKPSKK